MIACGQDQVMPDTCPECGGWLGAGQPGGYPARVARVCSEECAAGQSERIDDAARDRHLHLRDVGCACEVCATAGLAPAPESSS